MAAAVALADAAVLNGVKKQTVCRALAMSGGANNGAWENGVMWGLTHFGKDGDYNWDVVTGVSAGAINTAYTSAWAPSETKEMTESLKLAWQSLTTHQIWKLWPGGIAAGLFKKGLVDDSPALTFLTEQMG